MSTTKMKATTKATKTKHVLIDPTLKCLCRNGVHCQDMISQLPKNPTDDQICGVYKYLIKQVSNANHYTHIYPCLTHRKLKLVPLMLKHCPSPYFVQIVTLNPTLLKEYGKKKKLLASQLGEIVKVCQFFNIGKGQLELDALDLTELEPVLPVEMFETRHPSYNKMLVERLEQEEAIQLTRSHLEASLKHTPESLPIVQYIHNQGLKIDNELSVMLCQYASKPGLEWCFGGCKIIPTKQHFKAIFEPMIQNYKTPSGCYHWYVPKVSDYVGNYQGLQYIKQAHTPKVFAEFLEILFKYGYKPDVQDIIQTIQHHITIPKVERFGLELGEDVVKACCHASFFPYEIPGYEEKLKLYRVCAKPSIGKLRKVLKDIPADSNALVVLIINKGTVAQMDLLISKGAKITKEVFDVLYTCGSNTIYKKYSKVYVDQLVAQIKDD